MVLDLVEVAESHTGENLGIAFTTVLKKFGLEEKVRALVLRSKGLKGATCTKYLQPRSLVSSRYMPELLVSCRR